MADPETQKWVLVDSAIETNDATLLNEALSMTPAEDLKQFYDRACNHAIRGNSIAILSCLIDHGVNVKHLNPGSIAYSPDPIKPPSKAIPEFLLAHGWDINWRGDSTPFMWSMVRNADMVAWCLEHGASVFPSDRPWERFGVMMAARHCDQILEWVGNMGNVAAFELLRSKGAPLGQRTLHRAVEVAAFGHDGPADPGADTEKQREDRAKHAERMDLVRHLLDVVKLDINAPDQAPGCTKGMSSAWGTPICYVPGVGMPERDSHELTWLLLDRGADPALALKLAKEMDNRLFIEDVEVWMEQNLGGPAKIEGRGRSCCSMQ